MAQPTTIMELQSGMVQEVFMLKLGQYLSLIQIILTRRMGFRFVENVCFLLDCSS